MNLNDILKQSFNTGELKLGDTMKLNGIGEWDSLAHMFFITKIEREFGVELTGDEIANLETVGDIKKLLSSKGKTIE
jgi:acyl carrier protein